MAKNDRPDNILQWPPFNNYYEAAGLINMLLWPKESYGLRSSMRFIKSALEYRPIDEIAVVPPGVRGIYALYMRKGKMYELVYIGMSGREANGRIRSRLHQHKKNKIDTWSHFSYYEVWDNITELEIRELEGLFRQLYRFSSNSNSLNRQQTHKPLIALRRQTEKDLGLPHINKKVLGIL